MKRKTVETTVTVLDPNSNSVVVRATTKILQMKMRMPAMSARTIIRLKVTAILTLVKTFKHF